MALQPEVSVLAGDAVDAGSMIGLVGNTSLTEAGLGAHLHFLYRTDTKYNTNYVSMMTVNANDQSSKVFYTRTAGSGSLGAHLHFSVAKDGEIIDPAVYLGE